MELADPPRCAVCHDDSRAARDSCLSRAAAVVATRPGGTDPGTHRSGWLVDSVGFRREPRTPAAAGGVPEDDTELHGILLGAAHHSGRARLSSLARAYHDVRTHVQHRAAGIRLSPSVPVLP